MCSIKTLPSVTKGSDHLLYKLIKLIDHRNELYFQLLLWILVLFIFLKSEVAQSCLTLGDPMDCSLPGSSVHGILHERILGVGCHFLLQGIFPTQGSNLHLLHCWWFFTAEPPGKPKHLSACLRVHPQLHVCWCVCLLCLCHYIWVWGFAS